MRAEGGAGPAGALPGLTLVAVQATGDSLAVVIAQGALAPITLTAPNGAPGVDVVGQGAMAGIHLVAPAGQGGQPGALLPPAYRTYIVPAPLRAHRVRSPSGTYQVRP